jgi:hypothetical protein
MRTIEISNAYQLLNAAKINKLDTESKYTVIKAIRAIKPIATSYDEFIKDAQERLKGEEHDDIVAKAQQWQREGENTTLNVEERAAINEYLNAYNQRVVECVQEEAEKEQPLVITHLSEEAFGQLMASNEAWEVKDILLLQELLVA